MIKCEYCGEEIGLLAVRYTWLDKKNNRAMHDKCLEEYKRENPEIKQIDEEKQTQKEEVMPLEKMVKSKILGIIILMFAISFTLFAIYSLISFGFGFSIYNTLLFAFSYIIGIVLIMIRKGGIYHKLILICGVIILALYMIMLMSLALILTLW